MEPSSQPSLRAASADLLVNRAVAREAQADNRAAVVASVDRAVPVANRVDLVDSRAVAASSASKEADKEPRAVNRAAVRVGLADSRAAEAASVDKADLVDSKEKDKEDLADTRADPVALEDPAAKADSRAAASKAKRRSYFLNLYNGINRNISMDLLC